jgi:hypothetical protein
MIASSGKRFRVTQAAYGSPPPAWQGALAGNIFAFNFDRDTKQAIDAGQIACTSRVNYLPWPKKGKPAMAGLKGSKRMRLLLRQQILRDRLWQAGRLSQ